MAMTLLPRFFVPESGRRYLSVTENLSAGLPSGFLKFDEEQIWNPRVKFEVDVHIRSCYNNKYWEALPDRTRVISASGEKPEEDRSKVSCTLFEVHPVLGNTGALRLRFVQSGIYASRLLPHSTHNVAMHDPVPLIRGGHIRDSSLAWMSEIHWWPKSSSPLLMETIV
ncbi:Hfr-2-like protein [Tanacetum coccineum]|uniref:Hfr-2-like protein n=1 Tax=Tanacetum coccineum TaxID=301880 RepID=A0ABQ5IB98_9ASTR